MKRLVFLVLLALFALALPANASEARPHNTVRGQSTTQSLDLSNSSVCLTDAVGLRMEDGGTDPTNIWDNFWHDDKDYDLVSATLRTGNCSTAPYVPKNLIRIQTTVWAWQQDGGHEVCWQTATHYNAEGSNTVSLDTRDTWDDIEDWPGHAKCHDDEWDMVGGGSGGYAVACVTVGFYLYPGAWNNWYHCTDTVHDVRDF